MYEAPQKVKYNILKLSDGNFRVSYLERQENSMQSKWVTIGRETNLSDAEFLVKMHAQNIEEYFYDDNGKPIKSTINENGFINLLNETN